MNIPTREELEAAGIKIVVGLPMERNVPDIAFLNFWEIARHGYPIIHKPYGRVDDNRNYFAKQLLKSDFTHLAMFDIDHLHPANIIERLAVNILEDPKKLIVGGINFRRGEPFDPCAYVLNPEGGISAPISWEQGVGPVEAIGHGSIIISREVFEQIEYPYWAFAYSAEIVMTEDILFCQQVREAGIEIWCDTRVSSPHLINATVDESSWHQWLADHPEKIRIIEETEQSPILVPPLLKKV